jgi:hypothetical protein
MKKSLSEFVFLSLTTFLFAGCMVVPQTYTPKKLHPTPRINAFLPDNYEDDLGKDDNPPAISVVVDGNDGGLDVDVCSRGWDWRRIKVLADQCSLTDDRGLRYRLGTFKSIDFANKQIGESRWIQYTTYAYGPLPSSRPHTFYGGPHTLRVVYTEDGRRYTAERQFAATYPLITPFQMLHFTN